MRLRVSWRIAAGVAGIVLATAVPALLGQDRNPSEGEKLFGKRCAGCHALDDDREGPRLRGVYGRLAGSVGSFEYSEALKKSGIHWNEESLDKWLADPQQLAPNNDMAFRLEKPAERLEIIAYLKKISEQ